jgi:hypothetical protein
MPPATAFDVRQFIDEQPVGRYQLMVASMCSLIVFVDGFDAQAMGYVAPALSAAMQIPRSVLGPVISSGLVGMMIGAMVIGLNVKQEVIEASAHVSVLRRGDFDVASDANCGFVVEPDTDLQKFQSTGISDNNYGRYKDPVWDDLFIRQARAVDPEERKRLLRALEKRLLDEEAHYIYTLQWHRIVAHSSKVRGWIVTPSHFLNQQLDGVWLAE